METNNQLQRATETKETNIEKEWLLHAFRRSIRANRTRRQIFIMNGQSKHSAAECEHTKKGGKYS